ncbi:hypothetical protein ACHAXR_007194 [Thalassiosira sp. AJA248-18]
MPPKKKPVFRDEIKGTAQKENDKNEVIRIVENVLGEMLEYPQSWNDPSLANVRSMVRRIGTDPTTYPLPFGDEDDAESSKITNPPVIDLTKDVARSLYARDDLDLSNITLQITASTPEMVSTKLIGDLVPDLKQDIPHRQWKMNAIDGDNNVITLRLDSTLNSEGAFLTPGVVLRVTSAFPVYMNYGDMYDMRCAIVLRDFNVIGRQPVPSMFLGPPLKRLKVEAKELDTSIDENVQPTIECSKDCTGQLCSQHGIDFSVCLTKCVPIESVSLARVASVFVTKELKDMSQKTRDSYCIITMQQVSTSSMAKEIVSNSQTASCLKSGQLTLINNEHNKING